jgi:glyoxylase-like metal-dependent hydrolase (beta-lactamase superfamily II)
MFVIALGQRAADSQPPMSQNQHVRRLDRSDLERHSPTPAAPPANNIDENGNAMPKLTRRNLLAGSAAAAALAGRADLAAAAEPAAGKQAPGIYRYRIGSFELTALYDGIWYRPITDKFIRNAPFPEVERALAAAFMPADKLATPFTTLVVNTGSKLALVDTGTGGQIAPSAGVLGDNLAAAGIDPKAVDLVVISHFHPDHINGIKDKDNGLVFPNAEIMVSAPEWAFWMDDANMNAAPADLKLTFRNQRRIFSDIAKQITRFKPGDEVAPGIVTLPAPGHTPGHTVFAIHSGDQSLMVLGDTAQHPAVFARHPDWQAAFDVDGDAAVATRKMLFDRAAADRMLVTGYHFPFPACGHLVKTAGGYEHVPVLWQPTL